MARKTPRVPPRKAVLKTVPPRQSLRRSPLSKFQAKPVSTPVLKPPPPENLGDTQSMAVPVRFTLSQYEALRRLRQISGTPMQEIVRRAVDAFVAENPHGVPPMPVS